MRIALVSPFHLVGGGESYSLNLAKALSKTNNSVNFFVNSQTKETSTKYVGKLKITSVKSTILPIDPGNPVSLSLMKALLNEEFDVIHAHQMYSFFNLCSSFSGRIKRGQTVLTDHGGGWRLAAFPHVCANAPEAFAAVSEFSLQRMLSFAPKKTDISRVVYGGVNTEDFHVLPPNNELRDYLKLTDENVVLCLGRVLPHKGIDVAINALPYMPKNTRLLVVGEVLNPEYFYYLKKIVHKHVAGKVTFLGGVAASELPAFYNLCDVFVQPSVYFDYKGRYHKVSELLGLSRLEAMACGKPVVVSKVGGLTEKIVNGENGYIFEPGNEKQLACYVTQLLLDKNLQKKIGGNALSTVKRELVGAKLQIMF